MKSDQSNTRRNSTSKLYIQQYFSYNLRDIDDTEISDILASASFWPLLIIESMASVSQHVLFTHYSSSSKCNVKCELDCFN